MFMPLLESPRFCIWQLSNSLFCAKRAAEFLCAKNRHLLAVLACEVDQLVTIVPRLPLGGLRRATP